MLRCINCGRTYDPEGWDPMGGDCPIVLDEDTKEVIAPDKLYSSMEAYATKKESK